MHFEAQDLTRFTFNQHLEWSAADFAVSREALRGGACVDQQVKALPAIRALNGFAGFHVERHDYANGNG